jgi:hypothetical protein
MRKIDKYDDTFINGNWINIDKHSEHENTYILTFETPNGYNIRKTYQGYSRPQFLKHFKKLIDQYYQIDYKLN